MSAREAETLKRFSGTFTLGQIQRHCERTLGDVPKDWVLRLVERLIQEGVLQMDDDGTGDGSPPEELQGRSPQGERPPGALKPSLLWTPDPDCDEKWLLTNPENQEWLEIAKIWRQPLERVGYRSPADLAAAYGFDLRDFQDLYANLADAEMLVDVARPQRTRGKWTPMRLMSFRRPLFNPDPLLNRYCRWFLWMRSPWFGPTLTAALVGSLVVMLDQSPVIFNEVQVLWQVWGGSLLLPFALLVALVVSVHEFGHALALKTYGGTVPTIGLLFMLLIPIAYTDVSDANPLPRHQRAVVFGAGIVVQAAIAVLAFWLWCGTAGGSWLHVTSCLLMGAATFTLLINFNPLMSYDGYYLLSALTGIRNLRAQSFKLYGAWLTGKPEPCLPNQRLTLAVYAPFSLAYSLLVMGTIALLILHWSLAHIPVVFAMALLVWLIYYLYPDSQ
ncbi:MAG: hypothetical protein MH825_10755 [Cyanobacteria bacterium]|nr:hypothetical protein [Cyanobacteriota bacterium]